MVVEEASPKQQFRSRGICIMKLKKISIPKTIPQSESQKEMCWCIMSYLNCFREVELAVSLQEIWNRLFNFLTTMQRRMLFINWLPILIKMNQEEFLLRNFWRFKQVSKDPVMKILLMTIMMCFWPMIRIIKDTLIERILDSLLWI